MLPTVQNHIVALNIKATYYEYYAFFFRISNKAIKI